MTTAVLNHLKIDSVSLPQVNWKTICFAGFLVSLVLPSFYVWQVNSMAKGSYLINSYQKQISKLSGENKNLQVSFAESSFLGQVSQKAQALNFQKAVAVKYVQIPDSSVAVIKK